MGASSIRFAHGRLESGVIKYEIVHQVANTPNGRFWDIDLILNFCREAVSFAKSRSATVGIDSWGVDHGFVGKQGEVLQAPVMYRDASHQLAADELAPHRRRLYELTGIAHQPFNTLYQLVARKKENPKLVAEGQWLLMPDLLGYLLTGKINFEQTQASTTQMMGVDGKWCSEIFDLAGCPMPTRQPSPCGEAVGTSDGTQLLSVASHDTGSAVVGVGSLGHGTAYLNVGTWALLGTILDSPNTSIEAEQGGWTSEWHYDGRIRFLKNIPGFYVINRVHSELGIKNSISEWLKGRDLNFQEIIDQQDPKFYNPLSMTDAISSRMVREPRTEQEWAQVCLNSLVKCIASDIPKLRSIAGVLDKIRIVGGGSQGEEFCQAIATETGCKVESGPVEATVLGNLAVQFAGVGAIDRTEIESTVDQSIHFREYAP